MACGLDPTAAPARIIAYEALASTNARALELARRGERGPLWITARLQTAGRGRRGRVWVSQPGNLYATLLLTAPSPARYWPHLSLVAALAVHDAVVEVAPALAPLLAIKWPNDLLIDGNKLAGILIEGEGRHGGAVAVGIGVNCASHPAIAEHPATDLAAAGFSVIPSALLDVLARMMTARLAQWNSGRGFSAVRADWCMQAAALGQPISVRLADREVEGIFETIDAAGSLVLRLEDGDGLVIPAGDVFVLTGFPGRSKLALQAQ